MSDQKQDKETIPVEIPIDILGQLKWLSNRLGKPPEETLRQAISTEAYIQEEIEKKGYVHLVEKFSLKKVAERVVEKILSLVGKIFFCNR